jgi:hypothetical protein
MAHFRQTIILYPPAVVDHLVQPEPNFTSVGCCFGLGESFWTLRSVQNLVPVMGIPMGSPCGEAGRHFNALKVLGGQCCSMTITRPPSFATECFVKVA